MNRATGLLLAGAAMLALAGGLRADDVEIDGLKSKTPKDWKAKEIPENLKQFRAYMATLPKAEGDKDDADLVVFYFGQGGGGGVDANVKRWKDTFNPPEGKTIDDVSKVENIKVGDVKATVLSVSGTYKFKAAPFDPNSPTVMKPDYKMVGVVFESPKGPYFFRLTGPAKTIDKHQKAFDEWLKNFK
jgi:hypothetical protein